MVAGDAASREDCGLRAAGQAGTAAGWPPPRSITRRSDWPPGQRRPATGPDEHRSLDLNASGVKADEQVAGLS